MDKQDICASQREAEFVASNEFRNVDGRPHTHTPCMLVSCTNLGIRLDIAFGNKGAVKNDDAKCMLHAIDERSDDILTMVSRGVLTAGSEYVEDRHRLPNHPHSVPGPVVRLFSTYSARERCFEPKTVFQFY